MAFLDFDYEIARFLFRGKKVYIQRIYAVSERHCTDEPVCVGDDIWEVEVVYGAFESLIESYPQVKAAGFVLNWDTKMVCVAYSESGCDKINKVRQIAGFDGHTDAELQWHADCPITAEHRPCKEFYSNSGEYDRFHYTFPFAKEWNDGRYSDSLLSDTDRAFRISEDGVLEKCESTDELIRIPDGVRVIGSKAFVDGPFASNRTVQEVSLPDSVREIAKEAFYCCEALTSIKLNEGLESIAEGAFSVTKLKELYLPRSLKNLDGKSLSFCPVVRIHVPEDHPIFVWENDCLFDKVNHRLVRCFSDEPSVTVPNGVAEICDRAFYERQNLVEVHLPEGLRRVGEGAFSFCRKLRRVSLPATVTELGSSAFEFCNDLEHVDLPAGLIALGSSTFGYCNSLNHLVIPDGVPAIRFGTFSQCTSLSDLHIPQSVASIDSFNLSGLVDTPWYTDRRSGSVFIAGSVLLAYKKNEPHVVIPDGIRNIASSVFAGKKKLEQVDFPDSLEQIDGNAFSGCSNLKKAVLPDSVTKIFWGAFADCPSLEYLYAVNTEANMVPMGNGKCVSDTMVAVLPNLKLADQKPAAWKLALARGYLLHPELVPEDIRQENLETVLKLRKKLLPWVFATDNVAALKLFLDNTKTTKAKLKSEYQTPAEEAGAKECLAYLAQVKV